jgi:hypothetical protein
MNEQPDIEYRGHFIVVQSSESEGTRWRPKALVSLYHSGTVHRKIVAAPVDVLFDSEDAADTYSLAMAKKWIDDNAGSPMP